jgi:dTDP-4-dehydrorhamnose reductase
MRKPLILVTGASGQLGRELSALSSKYPAFDFAFLSHHELPINDFEKVQHFLESTHPSFCINCAAYTAVDKAETEKEIAYLINAQSVGSLAAACRQLDCRFIHISTDYVFDGNSSVPLKEQDVTNPINIYGAFKLLGEELAVDQNNESLIIRTSWVYSEFGSNFVKTMIRLMGERQSINVVSDQIGSPTYAADLADAILHIASNKKFIPGIYNYSNEGSLSWYDFAIAIKQKIGSNCKVNPIATAAYPTPAKRPSYSLLDKTKISLVYSIAIKPWSESLVVCLDKIKNAGIMDIPAGL